LKLKLTVDGKVYEVDVEVSEPEQPHPTYIPPAGPTSGAAPAPRVTSVTSPANREKVADESKVCRSPISGVVVRVSAQVGQAIQTHDVLMVLEAMKMETEITSPIDGKITKINAKVGDSVQGSQVLVEFE
jgi:methylmalonyl-CoA carboxyltransferase small subunit